MRQDSLGLTIPDSHRFAKHKPGTISKFSDILQISEKNKNINSKIREKYSIRKHTIIPLDGHKKSPTITTLPDDYIHYCEPRILTVREYARIQVFQIHMNSKENTQQEEKNVQNKYLDIHKLVMPYLLYLQNRLDQYYSK